jgi:hypothetical protein
MPQGIKKIISSGDPNICIANIGRAAERRPYDLYRWIGR